jgi:hypothetical protein
VGGQAFNDGFGNSFGCRILHIKKDNGHKGLISMEEDGVLIEEVQPLLSLWLCHIVKSLNNRA